MNILLINHYAGSLGYGMEYRPYYLAREWVKLGHNVNIVAADYSHLRKNNPIINKSYEITIEDGIQYIWFRTLKYKGNGIGRFANIFHFLIQLHLNKKRIIRECNPDVVIASSTYPFDNWMANKIAKNCKALHVYEVHDLWPLTPIELGGFSKYHPFILLTQYFEDFGYRKADKVVSLLSNSLEYMKTRGLPSDRFCHIPNGIDLNDWGKRYENVTKTEIKLKELKQQGCFIVGYLGGHGLSNSLDNFIKAAELMKNQNSIKFVSIGDGPLKYDLIETARSMNLGNIIFFPPVEKVRIPDVLTYFDICYIGYLKRSLYRYGICPNKLVDYMMSSKPIILGVEAGISIVDMSKCGLTIPPEDPEEVIKAVIYLKNLEEHERIKMGENGREYVVNKLQYSVLAQEFLACLNS